MGVWEEALREAAALRLQEVQSLQRQRDEVAEQGRALSRFIDRMHRLQVRPQRRPFLVQKGPPTADRYRASRRHKVVGWDIGAGAVVTPDGSVYDIKDQDREPCDLRRPLAFPRASDRPQALVDLLQQALVRVEEDQ
jgi:hypothetical protein